MKFSEIFNRNWKVIILVAFLFIIILSTVMFIKWNFSTYHEVGHLKGCDQANISCSFKKPSFLEYSNFVVSNVQKGHWTFAEMEIKPKNLTEFCNLSFEKQQLIRLGGFRNDSKVLLWLSLTLTIELLLFLGFILFLIIQKKSISLKWILLMVLIIFLTGLLLHHNTIQFKGYLYKNIGDLFFNPCI